MIGRCDGGTVISNQDYARRGCRAATVVLRCDTRRHGPCDWLLDSDPAIRWQVMRDVTGEADKVVDAERAKVAEQGWGARLLALPERDGAGGREWDWLRALLLLREMGLDPASAQANDAIAHVSGLTWHGTLPKDADWHGRPFFAGEVEPCINGRVVAVGAYFGQDVRAIVDRLLGEQCDDGGWNCEAENGSTRGSFHTTICVLEGLLEYERATTENGPVCEARERGQEYLLQRRMLRRRSTGGIIDEAFARFAFPTGYQYDVLRERISCAAQALLPMAGSMKPSS